MWLRLHHTVDPETGELRYRSASSTDGETWRWGATWTLPADSDPRVGLYAGGGSEPATVAQFESVTFSAVNEQNHTPPASSGAGTRPHRRSTMHNVRELRPHDAVTG